MNKILEHIHWMNVAKLTAKRSKCVSQQVGCVIIKDGDIIISGYNGTPSGYINCNEHFHEYNELHHEWSNIHEIHAEQNAICRAARLGKSIENSSIYCTLKPCMHCTKLIVMSGIKNIYFLDYYHRNDDKELDSFLKDNNVNIEQVTLESL